MDDMSQPTQPATQNVIDPRRIGKQNSGFTDEDIADIVCLLFPFSVNARNEAARLAREGSPFVIGREQAQNVEIDYAHEDYAGHFGLSPADPGSGPAFVLRLSAQVKDPLQGFTFGRNAGRCDICFSNDTLRRLSNIHFRIYINEHGVLMLQDQSTNGTVVDDVLLKARRPGQSNRRTLNSGTTIAILLQNDAHDLKFLVRVPRREGQYEAAYMRNLRAYLDRLSMLANANDGATQQTIGAGPGGLVNLFPVPPQSRPTTNRPLPRFSTTATDSLPREWGGSDNYNRVGQIGKGAFATVHKVTSKFNGEPYAAKELDKRRFIKNGVLDQKVENEMKIMQKVQHPNIVRYIEHFDFDDRLLIIIMEYVPLGDLGSYIHKNGCLPEDIVMGMARQLIDALDYLHRKNITHRDVKPDNILIGSLSPFSVKLTDFGLSKMVDTEDTFLRTFCGTLLYCAPEVYSEFEDYNEQGMRVRRFQKRPRIAGQRYDHAVDIWSLGGVLFYCLTGRPPYPVKQGTNHNELLAWIMSSPLNVEPLQRSGVSPNCIHFISIMLRNRPEKRASIEELQQHPWLAGSGLEPDAANDDSLEKSASQLSILDNDEPSDSHLDPLQSDDEILDDSLFGLESQFGVPGFPNNALERGRGEPAPQRLFGEVNVSAIGSSGAIPEDRLNLPLSEDGSFLNQPGVALSDSDDDLVSAETFLSPKAEQRRQRETQQQWSQPWTQPRPNLEKNDSPGNKHISAALSQPHDFHESRSVGELNNLTFDVASQSLGGAESILGNLNMKSLATSNFKHSVVDFSSSKRKPEPSTSDEFESAPSSSKPTIKRLKSEVHIQSASEPSLTGNGSNNDEASNHDELEHDEAARIYEAIKPISHSRTGREMDLPVPKSVYWTPGDPSSWHLRYPEMTQLQHDAFEEAAIATGEKFCPGASRLWSIAMKHFPPTAPAAVRLESEPRSRSRSASRLSDTPASEECNDENTNDQKENIMPPAVPGSRAVRNESATASALHHAVPPSGFSTPLRPERTVSAPQQSQHAQIVVPVVTKQQAPVALLESVPGSVVRDIFVPISEAITSWGRHPDNTQVYVPKTELKVPKYAFKILVWRGAAGGSGSEPWKELQPWSRWDGMGEAASQYHFFISTKARGGILVNGTPISSSEPSQPQMPSRYWTRLYDGDSVVVWHNMGDPKTAAPAKPLRTELVFRCKWGGSAKARSALPDTLSPVTLIDETTSRRLDEAYSRAERFVGERAQQQRLLVAASHDMAERKGRIEQERFRSVEFERKRAAILASWQRQQQQQQQQQRRPRLPPSLVSAPPVLATANNEKSKDHTGSSNGGSSSVTPTPSVAVS